MDGSEHTPDDHSHSNVSDDHSHSDASDDHSHGNVPDDRPHLVGHVHLKVRDLEHALDFYTAVLGLAVEERHGRFAFLRFGQRHHDVALQEVGRNAAGPGQGVGLYHAAFEVGDADALVAIYDRAVERGVHVSPVDHGISKALYFADPDGNGLEVYLDTREQRGRDEWQGTNERFDPRELSS